MKNIKKHIASKLTKHFHCVFELGEFALFNGVLLSWLVETAEA